MIEILIIYEMDGMLCIMVAGAPYGEVLSNTYKRDTMLPQPGQTILPMMTLPVTLTIPMRTLKRIQQM